MLAFYLKHWQICRIWKRNLIFIKKGLICSCWPCLSGVENYQILFSLHLIHRSQAFQFLISFSFPLIQLERSKLSLRHRRSGTRQQKPFSQDCACMWRQHLFLHQPVPLKGWGKRWASQALLWFWNRSSRLQSSIKKKITKNCYHLITKLLQSILAFASPVRWFDFLQNTKRDPEGVLRRYLPVQRNAFSAH